KDRKEVMALLLAQREIAITEKGVECITESFDTKVMTLLLDRWGDQVTVTEEVVIAAAGNEKNGKGIMTLLLDRRGDQITVTEKVVIAAARNEENGKELMA